MNTTARHLEIAPSGPQSGSQPAGSRKISVKQVDAFTEIPMTGNPAGVVADAGGLTDQEMQIIAREMSLPETAFVLPASSKDADLRIRWFSPTVEVPLCGHATIATFHTLASEGMFGMKKDGSYHFTLESQSGLLPVTVEKAGSAVDVWLGLHLPDFKRAGIQKLDVMRILNVSLDEFEPRLPIVADKYLYVPVRRLHTLFSLQPNFFALSQFLVNRNLSGLCVFTTETVDRASSVHSRFFSPHTGINEDPVTGSANGPLGVYLFENGAIEPGGIQPPRRTAGTSKKSTAGENTMVSMIGEQGDAIGRKGRVTVRLSIHDNQVDALTIGGRAVTVFSGELRIA